MNQVLINEKGELLEILQDLKEPQEGEYIVPIEGYYEVFNIQGFKYAKYDFEAQLWEGYHKPFYNGKEWVESATEEEIAIARPIVKKVVSETEKLWDIIDRLMADEIRK